MNLIRKLFGRKPVEPVDHVVLRMNDNEHLLKQVTWHGSIPFAAPYLPQTACELLPGGKVIGPCYVKAWRPATPRMSDFHDARTPPQDSGSSK
jgi:hypothetical protein